MDMKKMLSKIDLDEIYKDIYAQPEYRRLGKIAQDLLYAKKMKDYEIGVFEGVAKRYIDEQMITCDWVSAMPDNDRRNLSILSYAVYMLSDVLESYITDINTLMKKNTDRKVSDFDKLNMAVKESRKVVSHFDKSMCNEKALSMFGDFADDLYKMIFNKLKKQELIRKLHGMQKWRREGGEMPFSPQEFGLAIDDCIRLLRKMSDEQFNGLINGENIKPDSDFGQED